MSIKSTAIFDFLLKKFQKLIKFITQSYLFIISEFIFILKCLPNNYFFRWFAYKSLLSRFSVLISYNMCSCNHFSISSRFQCFSRSRFFRVQVFQGPGFSGSRFFRVQVFQGPGFQSPSFQGPDSGSGSRVQSPGSRSRVQGPTPGPGCGSSVRVQVIEVARIRCPFFSSFKLSS